MKHIFMLIASLAYSSVHADCSDIPAGMELAKSIEAKEINKAKKLLEKYKADVKTYVASCDKNKDAFEVTSVMVLTYEDRLKDMVHDSQKVKSTSDCSTTPSVSALEKAIKSKNTDTIKQAFSQYKTASQAYLDNCASHPDYATVYDEFLFYEEEYGSL